MWQRHARWCCGVEVHLLVLVCWLLLSSYQPSSSRVKSDLGRCQQISSKNVILLCALSLQLYTLAFLLICKPASCIENLTASLGERSMKWAWRVCACTAEAYSFSAVLWCGGRVRSTSAAAVTRCWTPCVGQELAITSRPWSMHHYCVSISFHLLLVIT